MRPPLDAVVICVEGEVSPVLGVRCVLDQGTCFGADWEIVETGMPGDGVSCLL